MYPSFIERRLSAGNTETEIAHVMASMRLPNAPAWAKYVVCYTHERAHYTGLRAETRYFKSLATACTYADKINEEVLTIDRRPRIL